MDLTTHNMDNLQQGSPEPLLKSLRNLISEAKQRVAVSVNSELTLLYWHIGGQINSFILQGERAEYGKQIVATIAKWLTEEFGTSFTEKNIRRMMQFAAVYADERIVVPLIRQLTWTHFIALIPITDGLKRSFYEQLAIMEHWSVRTLRNKIESQLFERTAISRKPESTIKHDLELLHLEDSNIRVAEYLTALPDKEVLEQKLQAAIAVARQRFAIMEQIGDK